MESMRQMHIPEHSMSLHPDEFRKKKHEPSCLEKCLGDDVLNGGGCFIYRFLCCPFVLVYHSFRIFCCTCLEIYYRWMFTYEPFTDKEFPTTQDSVGNMSGDTASGVLSADDAVDWHRVSEICEADGGAKLYEGEIEANDLLQGCIGDCWLIASMACVAQRPAILQQVIQTSVVDPRGQYHFRLWNQVRDEPGTKWVDIVIDDYIPTYPGTTEPKFANIHDGEVWAVLLEKAFAKMYGNYANLEAGQMWWGLTAMTGNPPIQFHKRPNELWQGVDNGYYTQDEFDDEEFFRFLTRVKRNGAFICCAGVPDENPKGLISGHAYSVIQIKKVQADLMGNFFQMVQIRNPHGGGEWNGPWSAKSSSWTQHPWVKSSLAEDGKEDGAFWMQWQDFTAFWSKVHVVDCSTTINSVGVPVFDEHHRLGPLGSCARGCLDYWFCCTGLKHLYFGRQGAGEVALMKKDMDKNCGVDQSGCYCNVLDRKAITYEDSDDHV
eukprot:TRINITY_DN6841_c0_g1_i1.p1 TRINITY_DN6841_c0_g1~~TRINITY_DN6841_c0_g1_i1.p1  ORF type:complete len:491 (+),score=88.35 TRINITY_DN6841_c0_g1_i1:107-1579(+)